MHPRTKATLKQLEQAAWFSKVGVPDTDKAIVLPSWDEAIKHCGSPEWEDLCLEAQNQYCERLFERSRERFNRWNEIAIKVKATTVPLVQRKIAPVVRKHGLPEVFEATVQWDILGICMEAEYADVYPPGFYAALSYFYAHGHFPCGWQGEFPKGRPVVY